MIEFIDFLSRYKSTNPRLVEAILNGYYSIFETPIEQSKATNPEDIVGTEYNEIRPTQDYVLAN